jgi:ferredoxin
MIFMAAMVNKEKCIGCGRCESVCPVGAIKLENGKAVVSDDFPVFMHTNNKNLRRRFYYAWKRWNWSVGTRACGGKRSRTERTARNNRRGSGRILHLPKMWRENHSYGWLSCKKKAGGNSCLFLMNYSFR